jgi:hypothetical protein
MHAVASRQAKQLQLCIDSAWHALQVANIASAANPVIAVAGFGAMHRHGLHV